VLIDTNILIAHLQGDKVVSETLEQWWKEGKPLFVSAISKIEVLSLPSLAHTQIVDYTLFLNSFISIPVDDAIVSEAARLRRQYRISLPDASIAATSILYRTSLVTRDKGFNKINEISTIKL